MATPDDDSTADTPHRHFLHEIIEQHNQEGRFGGQVHTRFPPEPNGYLHIGHAKAICLNFGLAKDFGGVCNLRFDDTNPTKEEQEFVDAIQEDVRWLGFDWEDRLFFASDFFEQLHDMAVDLIRNGKAYVDSLTAEEVREYRGGWNKAGKDSPHRDRSVEENLDLFRRMRAGEFADGTHTLRAKIDMASPNMNLRDPPMYRIVKRSHHRTGDDWCIYPTYDWAHGQCDSLEGITHSICTLEFENHRPLYDWFLDHLEVHHPQQVEFAPLKLSYIITSKRKLRQLVQEGHVEGWDDPRMPTLRGIRRRGYTPTSLRAFCDKIGVARFESTIELSVLEDCLRAELNQAAPRAMAVVRPLKVVITNYPEDKEETLETVNNPEDESAGTRAVPFSRELWIEQDDFKEEPPKKFFRLAPGREVRLRSAYFITCDEVVKGPDGSIQELRCSYDPESRGGQSPDGRKVKATLHWVSARHSVEAEVRLYDNLFRVPDPGKVAEGQTFLDHLNPDSKEVLQAQVEPSLAQAAPGTHFQFERLGYFITDTKDSAPGKPVFLRTVTLRDEWAKIQRLAEMEAAVKAKALKKQQSARRGDSNR